MLKWGGWFFRVETRKWYRGVPESWSVRKPRARRAGRHGKRNRTAAAAHVLFGIQCCAVYASRQQPLGPPALPVTVLYHARSVSDSKQFSIFFSKFVYHGCSSSDNPKTFVVVCTRRCSLRFRRMRPSSFCWFSGMCVGRLLVDHAILLCERTIRKNPHRLYHNTTPTTTVICATILKTSRDSAQRNEQLAHFI